jgi:hypothetical protein
MDSDQEKWRDLLTVSCCAVSTDRCIPLAVLEIVAKVALRGRVWFFTLYLGNIF